MKDVAQKRIIIADDHDVLIDGLMALLLNEDDLLVVGRANNGEQVLDIIRTKNVDLVILDIKMPKMDGVEVAKIIKKEYPNIKILVLSMYNKPEIISKVLKNGADGYILKNTQKKELLEAIRTVCDGKNYYSKEVTEVMMKSFSDPDEEEEEIRLSERETEIVKLIAGEFTSKEIAEKLYISHHTVERHRKNIFAKLGVRNVAGVVIYAMKNGLID